MATQAQERAPRAAAREVPQRNEEFAHLTLAALREYRPHPWSRRDSGRPIGGGSSRRAWTS